MTQFRGKREPLIIGEREGRELFGSREQRLAESFVREIRAAAADP